MRESGGPRSGSVRADDPEISSLVGGSGSRERKWTFALSETEGRKELHPTLSARFDFACLSDLLRHSWSA